MRKENPVRAGGREGEKIGHMVHFWIKCWVQRGHVFVYELIAIWEAQCCTETFFSIDNSSHLNCILSFKANTAFPCNKPNKIKYQEETWRKTTIFFLFLFQSHQALLAEEHCNCNFLSSLYMLSRGKWDTESTICK